MLTCAAVGHRAGRIDGFHQLFNLMVIVVVPIGYGVADTADIRKYRIHGVARSGGFHSRDNRLKGDRAMHGLERKSCSLANAGAERTLARI
jgi:hypothetical protein